MSWWTGGEIQRHARLRVAQRGDVLDDLDGRQLPAFTRLGALRDFDSKFVRRTQYAGVTPNRAEATCLTALPAIARSAMA